MEIIGRKIAVFLDEGIYYAIDNACPHKEAHLCDGIVFDRTVTCTWHGWHFSLEDGRVDRQPDKPDAHGHLSRSKYRGT